MCGDFTDEDGEPLHCPPCVLEPGVSLAEAEATLGAYPTAENRLSANNGRLRKTLEAYVTAEAQCRAGEHQECQDTVQALWSEFGQYPWNTTLIDGANLGIPALYSPLSIFDDYSATMLAHPERKEEPAFGLTVVVAARSRSITVDPAAIGLLSTAAVDPALQANDYAVIRESLATFDLFIRFLTEGHYSARVGIVLVDEEIEVNNSGNWNQPRQNYIPLHVPQLIQDQTHKSLLVFPRLIADYDTTTQTTGGNAGTMTFCPDVWFLKKKPGKGGGAYSRLERQAYLPRWLQHEYMHYVYKVYDSFGLEDKSHQWYNTPWPANFQGVHEIDYYHESINKILHPQADPPLHEGLRGQ